MKKTYQIPETKIVAVQTVKMIAASNESMSIGGKYNGTSTIESRRGGSYWDDDEDE